MFQTKVVREKWKMHFMPSILSVNVKACEENKGILKNER